MTSTSRPVVKQAPVNTAQEAAAELIQTEAQNKRMENVARFARWALEVNNFLDVLEEVAKSMNMAAATLAQGSPYYKEIQRAAGIAASAKELQTYYNSLNILKGQMPVKGTPEWDGWSDLQQVQFNYLLIESHLHDALESVHESNKDIAKQISDLGDAVVEKVAALTTMPMTSLPYADAYLFADAGGKIRNSLIDAANAYTDAEKSIRLLDLQAQAAIKGLEIRLRELGVSGLVLDMSDEDVRSGSLNEFTMRH